MEVYLIRHTTPKVEPGTCYGQSDVEADMDLFPLEWADIRSRLPKRIAHIYSSPLNRCTTLANKIKETMSCPSDPEYVAELLELHFGSWEMKPWDQIRQAELDVWMKDFVYQRPPGGESFHDLFKRVGSFMDRLQRKDNEPAVVVTHAGVIRSFIAHVNHTGLHHAIEIPCPYGSVYHIDLETGKTKRL